MRTVRKHIDNLRLNATTDLAQLDALALGEGGYLGLHCRIHNGAEAAPTDAPIGSWLLWLSSDGGATYDPYTHESVTSQLARIAPAGSTLVRGFAAFRGLPGELAKVQYVYGSGGGVHAVARLIATVEP